MSLRTPENVGKLQRALQAKAKAEPSYRFYSLWDKVCREDVLALAYARCRKNGGIAGADEEKFSDIEERGLEQWLRKLQEELRSKEYVPKPLLRIRIPKAN